VKSYAMTNTDKNKYR